MKTINLTVTDDTMRLLSNLATMRDKSFEEIVSYTLEHGLKDICYRSKRNAQKWQETKAMKERLEELEARLSER